MNLNLNYFISTVIKMVDKYKANLGQILDMCYIPINVFSQMGGGGITKFEKLGSIRPGLISYPCDTILCQKSPGCAFKFRHNFSEIF